MWGQVRPVLVYMCCCQWQNLTCWLLFVVVVVVECSNWIFRLCMIFWIEVYLFKQLSVSLILTSVSHQHHRRKTDSFTEEFLADEVKSVNGFRYTKMICSLHSVTFISKEITDVLWAKSFPWHHLSEIF